jgi:3-hydroxyacyl-CoA dehydrogenase/3a,7a,12a-trihydroxy-5b-cholest-24-enoyl-CoA hydratase
MQGAKAFVMSLLRFDGRVAVVTGAGRGLGREYALLLASRGAKVVVNDLGVERTGVGKNSQPVDDVVSTIRSMGGTAVPNYDSVEDGDKVIKTAIDNFGRVDILINNAGVIRDKSLARLSDFDWDLIHKVHLRGSFMCTRAAWPYMKKQNFGRIIMTSSPSGIYGNFGQSNYGAAKLGLVGFMNTLALEGRKYNIFTNTIAPTAMSRLTEGLIPDEVAEMFKVEYIAPVVVYMCHEDCSDNGSLIETFGGWASKLRFHKSAGVAMRTADQGFSVEDVRDNWDKITDFSDSLYHETGAESSGYALGEISAKLDESKALPGDFNSIIGHDLKLNSYTFTPKDLILYALGVGASLSQEDTSQLKFLYEGHEEFSALPSFAVIPPQASMMSSMATLPALANANLAQMLHGEQYIEIRKPFPTQGTLTHKGVIVDVMDKKSGAVILCDIETYDESGDVVAFNQFSTFIVGSGGYGGKRDSPHIKKSVPPPNREPDASVREKTSTSQAALYRLNGDQNPLHIDANFAALGGFSTPILHGLCSFGYAIRHVLKQYCNNDANLVKAMKTRFSKPVLPGHTLQTDMWAEGKRIHFICKIVESGDVVLSNGYVDLAVSVANQGSSAATPSTQGGENGLKSTMMFQQMRSMIESAGPEIVQRIRAVFLWKITKNGKLAAQWTVDLKTPPGSIYEGEPQGVKPGCTLTLSDDDFVGLATGELNPQQVS